MFFVCLTFSIKTFFKIMGSLTVRNLCTCKIFLIITYYVTCSDAACAKNSGVKRFGTNCDFKCHCFNSTEQCDEESGKCNSGCAFEWTGPGCQYRNIAYQAESRHDANINSLTYSNLATDNKTTTCSRATGKNGVAAWWALWLNTNVTFTEFVFVTSQYTLSNFPEFNVSVQQGISDIDHKNKVYHSGKLCYQHDRTKLPTISTNVKCGTSLKGNQLRIQLADISKELVLCDFRVYGDCDENCTRNCSGNCRYTTCHKKNNVCLFGCNPGFTGNTCAEVCEAGRYGERCSNNCSTHCVDTCDNVDGTCSSCKAGWKGDKCTLECDDFTYGTECKNNCSDHCANVCNKTDGSCAPCQPGWRGKSCSAVCHDGTYGAGCRNNCSVNCDGFCDKFNGTCVSCNAGWKGNNCTAECQDGSYGKNCLLNCSENCVGACNKKDGQCEDCKAGWKGNNCTTECAHGEWGRKCSNTCNNCLNLACDKINGFCSEGCKPGFKPTPSCNETCDSGSYGQNCTLRCGTCANNATCKNTNGYCYSGCSPGFEKTKLCKEECQNGTHGLECKNDCGMCKQTSHCHKVTGICSDGCLDGYRGRLCVEKVPQPFPVAGVVGGASSAVAIAALVVAGLVCLRKRRLSQSRTYKSTKESILSPAVATEEVKQSRKSEIRQNVYCNVSEVEKRLRDSDDVTTPSDSEDYGCEYTNDTATVSTNIEHEILVSNLKDYIKRGLADKKYFEDEFKKIPYGMQYPATVATSPMNAGKNRYKSMYAYDHTRVILQKHGPDSTDYINASNIMGYSRGNSYIAAQGPIQTTLEDFWRMIWEKNIRTIIMATNLSEEGKMKCLQYWPEIGQTAQYGHLSIILESEDEFTELVVRRLKVSHEGNPEKWRTVTQFHYRAWPDKGVPRCTSSLLHFWYQVRKHDAKKVIPWLVHCSAGVGRTGTFIAIDILYDEGTDKGSIDIYQCVNTLREQRVNMVQTKEQYAFLHNIMLEALVLAWKPVNMDKFSAVYDALREVDHRTGKTHLLLQYESLAEEPEVGKEQETQDELYSSAKKTENREKNRYDNILAPNEFRPFLYTQVTGCTDYLNAIYIPGYRYKHAYIITQAPLMTTAVDCCRLLIEEEIKVVVTFQDHNDEEVGEYLPARGIVKIGPFTSTFISEEDRRHSVLRNFEVKFKSQKHSVTQLIFKHWSPSKLTPSNVNEMLYFLEEVERFQRLTDCKPILIQCLNGAERSGLVAVLMNILERVRYDNEVSIIQVVRQMKVRRQQIIPNFEQYKFCHDVLLSNIQNDSTYANM